MKKDASNRKRSWKQSKSKLKEFQPILKYQKLHPPSAITARADGDVGSSSVQMAKMQGQMQVQVLIEMQAQINLQVQPLRRPQNPVEAEMAEEDAKRASNPDISRPFESTVDAVNMLLPYHVVADYEDDEDESNRQQQWDCNMSEKMEEYTTTFQRQVDFFNAVSRVRHTGAFRGEEKYMVEKAILEDEEWELTKLKAERERMSQMQAQAPTLMMNWAAPHGMMGFAGFGFRGFTGFAAGLSIDHGFNAPNGDDHDQ